jgi:hypothetical protein
MHSATKSFVTLTVREATNPETTYEAIQSLQSFGTKLYRKGLKSDLAVVEAAITQLVNELSR